MDIDSGRSLASRAFSYEGGATTTANFCCQITTDQFDKVHLMLKGTNLKIDVVQKLRSLTWRSYCQIFGRVLVTCSAGDMNSDPYNSEPVSNSDKNYSIFTVCSFQEYTLIHSLCRFCSHAGQNGRL